jgi:nucleotide-binding universal stress UspA family protein
MTNNSLDTSGIHTPTETADVVALDDRLSGRVVVGYDGSPESDLALDRAIEIARTTAATLHVVTAWHYPYSYGAYPIATVWEPGTDASDLVQQALQQRFGDDIPVWVTVSSSEGSAAKVLIDASAGADMLVVGSRGHGGFAGLLLGSVSSACAEHARCPVLIMHTDADIRHSKNSSERKIAVPA